MVREDRTVRYTAQELAEKRRRGETLSNWDRVDALTEEELEASIDHEEEGEFDWSTARLTTEPPLPAKKQLTLRLDADVIAWFRKQGRGYQTRMNQVLRSYVDAQREKGESDDTDNAHRKAS